MSSDGHSVVERSEDGQTLGAMPLLVACLVYASVSVSLYVTTGRPHVGTSYPVAFGLISMAIVIGVKQRWPDAC